MTVRKLIVLAVLALLTAPRVAAATPACACQRLKPPAEHDCCDPPQPKKEEPPKNDCCEVAPADRSSGEAVETVRTVVPSTIVTTFIPAAILTPLLPESELGSQAHGGDPPGDPPDLQLSHCTFRI